MRGRIGASIRHAARSDGRLFHLTAIDDDAFAGHERGAWARDEQHGIRDLIYRTEAAQRDIALDPVHDLRLRGDSPLPVTAGKEDIARCDRVHPDAVSTDLLREV